MLSRVLSVWGCLNIAVCVGPVFCLLWWQEG
jgi:hypothetical protein